MAQITHHCGNPPISVKIRGKTIGRQHDLKGRMPERSEWLLAGGVAKRNPRYHSAHQDAKNAKIGFLVDCFRVFLFSGMFSIPWVALTLNPRLRALGLKPSAFNLSGWIPSRQFGKLPQIITTHSTEKHNNVEFRA